MLQLQLFPIFEMFLFTYLVTGAKSLNLAIAIPTIIIDAVFKIEPFLASFSLFSTLNIF